MLSWVSPTPLTAVLVDDHEVMREALRMQLESIDALQIVAEAVDGIEGLARIHEMQPQVAFVDVNMPGLSGLALAARVRELGLATRIVLFTAFDDREMRARALAAGAWGFVPKGAGLGELRQLAERLRGECSAPEALS